MMDEDYKFVGCFIDDDDRLFDTGYTNNENMSANICYNKCRGGTFTHFGTEYSTQCFCGTDANLNKTPYIQRRKYECNFSCKGNWRETCGGSWRISVYEILPRLTTKPTSLTTQNQANTVSDETTSSSLKTTEAFTVSFSSIQHEVSPTTLSGNNTANQFKVSVPSSQISSSELVAAICIPIVFVISVLVIGFLLYRKRRSKHIHNKRSEIIDAIGSSDIIANGDNNDYTGHQRVAYPMNDISTSYTATYNNNDHFYEKRKNQDVNSELNGQSKEGLSYDYVAINTKESSTAGTPHIQTVSDPTDTAYCVLESQQNTPWSDSSEKALPESYFVLDPKETGFNRQNSPNETAMFQSLKSRQNEDEYDTCHKMSRRFPTHENVYSHTVDDVYDCASQTNTRDMSGDTYDHFFGQTTEGDYDITKRY